MFAIVSILGTQEKVEQGQKLRVPLLSKKEGSAVTFKDVLLLSKGKGTVSVGTPYVSGAAVEAKVLSHGKGKKIRVMKMKRRKRYRRTYGHRQDFTEIEITKISASSAPKASASVDAKKQPVKKPTKKPAKKE